MTLSDVVDQLDGFDDKDTISVGLRYILEVNLAKDAVRIWRDWRGGANPTLNDKLAAVIHYAMTDSFLPVA